MTKFSLEWQKAIEEDPTQAFELVCKNELLGDFIPEQLREEGFTSQATYAIKLIWDRVSQRPDDDPQQREDFIQAVEALRARLAEAVTENLVRETVRNLKEDIWKARYSTSAYRLKGEPELIHDRFWLSVIVISRSLLPKEGLLPVITRFTPKHSLRKKERTGIGLTARNGGRGYYPERKHRTLGTQGS